MTQLTINGKTHDVNADPDTPLLWVLREWVGMTGTKYGCGIAQCGACTVHLDGVATRACVTPLSLAAGKQILTIEGLAQNGNLHPVQKAWLEHDVPQCGYCQSGMIMAVAALLREKPKRCRSRHARGSRRMYRASESLTTRQCGIASAKPCASSATSKARASTTNTATARACPTASWPWWASSSAARST